MWAEKTSAIRLFLLLLMLLLLLLLLLLFLLFFFQPLLTVTVRVAGRGFTRGEPLVAEKPTPFHNCVPQLRRTLINEPTN